MTLIASARMYNVTAQARQAWADVFAWAARESGVSLEVVEHAAPAPLEDLWRRPDMGCVFMCGWPFSRSQPQPQLIAAPVPAGERYAGRPQYFTDLVVRRDRGFRRLQDTFGGRLGWTVEGSHSGYNALRHHLLAHRPVEGARLYAESLGPAVTPAAALDWVIEGKVDVAPLDSYALDLIRAHEPERVSEVEVIDSTAAAPIPPLVAATQADPANCAALRAALLAAGGSAEMQTVLATLCLAGFAEIPAREFGVLRAREIEALKAGYSRPE